MVKFSANLDQIYAKFNAKTKIKQKFAKFTSYVNKIKLIDTNKKSYIGNLVTTQLWRETIARQLMSFFENISNFHRYYSYFLTNDLIYDLNEILKIYNGTNNILSLMLHTNAQFKMEDIIEIFKLNVVRLRNFIIT